MPSLTESWSHPVRTVNLSHWEWLWNSFQGGRLYLAQSYTRAMNSFKVDEAARKRVHFVRSSVERGMLRRHERESEEGYAQRLDFATPINIVRPMVETIAAAVAKAGKVTLPAGTEELAKDIDGMGSDATEFHRQACAYLFNFGTHFVEVERRDPSAAMEEPVFGAQIYIDAAERRREKAEQPVSEVEASPYRSAPTEGFDVPRPPSRRDERESGVRSFLRHVTVLDLMHWSWDNVRRRFNWALIREHMPLNLPPPVDGQGMKPAPTQEPYACKLLFEGGWQRFVDGELVDQGAPYWDADDGIPLFPIILGQDPYTAEPFGCSETEDAAAIQRLVFNLHSWYIDDLYNNSFHQTVLDIDELPDDADRIFGASTYIRAKGASFLAPNPLVFDHMVNTIRFHVVLARQRLGLEAPKVEAPESGVALALRRENFDSFMAGVATAMEAGMRPAWESAVTMDGGSEEAVEVVFSKDFTAFNIAARLDSILNVWEKMGEALPPLAKAALLKDGVRAVTPELPEMERTAVDKEIDTAVEEEPEPVAVAPAVKPPPFGGNGKPQKEPDAEAEAAPKT